MAAGKEDDKALTLLYEASEGQEDKAALVAQLQETLFAMGVEADHSAGETLGRFVGHQRLSRPPPSGEQASPSLLDGLLQSLPLLAFPRAPTAKVEDSEFEFKEVLGQGGMGLVELVEQRSLHRAVACKRIRPEMLRPATVEALLEEARIMGALEHPNLIPVHSLGRDAQGHPILVMKRVEGVEWKELIHDDHHPEWGRIRAAPVEWHIEVVIQLCRALEFAHSKGVLHRDIKPSNVMIGPYGEVYLLDWGIALKREGLQGPTPIPLMGTPAYMAPEMLLQDAAALGPHTDIYLLGASLHEALTGQPRHRGKVLSETLYSVAQSEPYVYDEEIPEELAAICNRCMALLPSERFAHARQLREALEDHRAHRSSIQVCENAQQRLAELQQQLDSPSSEVHRLANECRFGAQLALQQWPQNPQAQEILHACRRAELQLAIGHKDLHRAQLLYRECDDIPPPLEALYAELLQDAARKQEDQEQLERLQFEGDLNVSRGARNAAVLLTLFGLLTMILVVTQNIARHHLDSMSKIVLGGVTVGLVVYAGILWVGREHFFKNAANRGIALSFLLFILAVLLNRMIGLGRGEHFSRILLTDTLIATAFCAMSALFIHRFMGVLAVGGLVALSLLYAYPQHTTVIVPTCAALLLVVGTAYNIRSWLRLKRPEEPHEDL